MAPPVHVGLLASVAASVYAKNRVWLLFLSDKGLLDPRLDRGGITVQNSDSQDRCLVVFGPPQAIKDSEYCPLQSMTFIHVRN